MKFVKYLRPFLVVAGFIAANTYAQTIGQETAFDRQLRQRDDLPLKEFVQSKENIDVKQKAGNLEISGDVRFEWRTIREKGIALYRKGDSSVNPDPVIAQAVDVEDLSGINDANFVDSIVNVPSNNLRETYRNIRGGRHVNMRGIPLSHNDFDVEFNLKVKYSFDRAFAFAHLQFDNPAGIRGRNECFGEFAVFNRDGTEVEDRIDRDSRWAIKGSGEAAAISLKRAYIGYNIWADGKHRLDIEVGRRKLDDIFESEIEFSNRFDGILLKYATALGDFSDFYWNVGTFVIDEHVNHFGYATEFGFLDIYDTGLDLRYSFIDWTKRGRNRCFIRHPIGASFQVSQISFSYTINPTFGCDKKMPIEFYGGFLVNHAAKSTLFTHHKKKNLGWYAGVYIGNVDKKGDWALDLEYIAVQAQAVSDYDVGSIGRGNILDELLTDIFDETFPYTNEEISFEDPYSVPSSYIVGYFPRRGNANFQGWRAEFLYAITDNLSLDMIYEFSKEEDRRIGGKHRYSDFEVEIVYAF